MRRRDVVVCVVVATLVVLAIPIAPAPIGEAISSVVILAARLWLVGAALLIASLFLRRRAVSPTLTRVLGIVGVTWTALVVAFYTLVLLLIAIVGAPGP